MAEAEVWPVNENAVHNNNNNVEEDEWGVPEDEEPKRINRVKKHMPDHEGSEGRVKSAEGKEPRRGNKDDGAEWMNDNDEPSSGRRERPDKGADRDRAERRDRTTHDRDRGDGRRDDRNQMDRRDRGDGRRDREDNSRRGSRDRGDSGYQGRDRGQVMG
ncbi:Oidioi.mRNA.OKI2018_I69.XSR.g16234.t1.cds [Oikopleura dioica]|uniref:Oidioi.mRNA.OKI2018_I69.XSR.g16234.t1.cds n=1 Tax=Oikopleura dioica TaxID=34765 RepID=A0ABN7SFF9_OIKDI|nr:Oidioi.mRNA.OKI2018_I69.XSR.g16234.t1.cds [Oikopleura dioica]